MAASIPAGFYALPLPIMQLSLAAVLKCGQSFRWSVLELPSDSAAPACHLPHEYRLCLKDRVVCLRQSTEHLFYRSVFPQATLTDTASKLKDAETLLWLRDYFQLDVDLMKLYREWAERDQVFLKLQDRFAGIRMLRQDPWENLVSYVYLHRLLLTVMTIPFSDSFAPPTTISVVLPRWCRTSVKSTPHPCSPYQMHSAS